jgi:hypothetical protein
MKKILAVVASLVVFALSTHAARAEKTYTFKKGQLVQVSGKACGLVSNKWRPVKKQGKRYVVDNRGGTRCATLLVPSSLKKSGLAQIPDASGMLKARSITTALDVTGSPPAIKDIPAIGAKDVFWAPGLVDAIVAATPPSQPQCSEFFAGTADGQSSGLLGCYSVQGVGYSFQSIMEGGSSVCFMKNVPTKANVAAGAVRVIEGSLPNGDITKIFSTPSGSKSRLIKVNVTGMPDGNQTGFIRINSQATLDKKGQQYSYNLWFCGQGQSSATNYEETSVSLAGEFKYLNVFVEGTSEYQNQITAYLTKSGDGIGFDVTKERSARTSGEFQGANFKSLITVFPNNTIATKVKESFNGFGRSNYGVASFSGAGLSEFAVRSAAIKDVFSNLNQQAGAEFRDTLYVSAPSTSLISELSKVDISTDSFYTQDGSVTPDFSDKSCSADADVTLSMDFANPALATVAVTCAANQLQNMDFCRTNEIVQAMTKCTGP